MGRLPIEPVLKYFLITDLRIRLLRPSFRKRKKPYHFQQLHYGITTVRVTGRCYCFGHASNCVQDRFNCRSYWDQKIEIKKLRSTNNFHNYSTGEKLRCVCQHNTSGDDCDKCALKYRRQNEEYGRAVSYSPLVANECNITGLNSDSQRRQLCNCNGLWDFDYIHFILDYRHC